MKQLVFFGFIFLCLIGCEENTLPKPKAYLSLNYAEPIYKTVTHDCPYVFDINESAEIIPQAQCWNKIIYPKMKATRSFWSNQLFVKCFDDLVVYSFI